MPTILYRLTHYKAAAGDRTDDHRPGTKSIGTYTSRERAEAAIRRLIVQPGFRDWIGGFRIVEYVLDQDVGTEGWSVSAKPEA